MDVLPSPRLFAAAWPRMLSGYVLDALSSCPEGRPDETGAERMEAFLRVIVEISPASGRATIAGSRARVSLAPR